jgi:hypothetical protein
VNGNSISSQTSTVDPADPLGLRKQEGGYGGLVIVVALIAVVAGYWLYRRGK